MKSSKEFWIIYMSNTTKIIRLMVNIHIYVNITVFIEQKN